MPYKKSIKNNMAKKQSNKNISFDKRDDDEMEDIEGENEKEFNPDSLDDALGEEEDDEFEEEESLDRLGEQEMEDEELTARDMSDEEDIPFWKL